MRRTMMFLNRNPYPILSQSIQAARKDGEEEDEEGTRNGTESKNRNKSNTRSRIRVV